MIPSKLYIPTTTLNFNNIMASESISPAGFYSVRGFGYKRFDKVEPNNLDNRIILYEKFPVFNINDKELENYPLVIEIDTKTIGEDIIQEHKNGVFYSEETIYLNPFSTQIIFNNETEKRSTLSKVEQSLNTKMVAIYQNRIIVKTPNIESFEWESDDLTDSKSDFLKISKDRKINKLKGFLYAYLLGANKSVSKNVVYAKKRTKSFSNELSALVNTISAKEADKILNCLDTFVYDINSISDKIKIEIKDLPILQHCNKVESVQNNKFLPKLFNEYLAEIWSSEEFVNSRLEFATAGGKLFKEELQDKWENSPYKNYINDLRNNLASHTAFSLQSTDNFTLQSFGAFCQKGEEDINKLEDYLISNGIGEFQIAFALWGIVFGFANTPKTLTNDLFLSSDLSYISTVYKYIFKQIHNIDLVGNLEKKQEEKEFVSLPSKMNEQVTKTPKTETPKTTCFSQEALEFYERLEEKCKGIKPDKETYLKFIENHGITSQLLDELKNDKRLNKGKGVQKSVLTFIEKEISPKKAKPKSKKEIQQESTLQFFNSSGNFLNDFDFLSSNNDFISIVSKHKDWKKDLKWFIDEYNNPNSQYYKGKSRENKDVIRKFIFLKKEKYKETEAFLLKLYS